MRGAEELGWGRAGSSDLAHEAEADEEAADDEEQRPLPQRVQVVLEHEDCARGDGAREARVAAPGLGQVPTPAPFRSPPRRAGLAVSTAPLGCCCVNG